MKIKKNKWVKITRNKHIEITFNDFGKGVFKFLFDGNEFVVKSRIIKISGKKKSNLFILSDIDTTIKLIHRG